jgi:hypothetical protein
VTYTPIATYNGPDAFTYTVSDGLLTSIATVNLTVIATGGNEAPSFTGGANQTVLEDAGARSVANFATNMSAGPANESGQTLSFLVSNSHTGLFSAQPAIAPNGTLTYTSARDANGTATVTVRLQDNGGTANGGVDTSAPQTFVITVTPVNDPPVAVSDTRSTNEDTPLIFPASSLTANDIDVDGDTLTVTAVTSGSKGTAVLAAGLVTYTPNPNVNGSDSFTYTVSDGHGGTATGTVNVTINPVNDAPVANNQSVTVLQTSSTAITLAAADIDSATLTYAIVAGPSHGTLSGVAPAVTYTPTPAYNGSDSFTFTASDGLLKSTARQYRSQSPRGHLESQLHGAR